ncbi:hypothetical protein PK98_07460 [Croceibacterium mercuriale]|uniref:TonB-dependent receptor n=1 Tax=Croceibacterium mercuriale TaxID=1572751 RepID=A0A0B2C3V2_9SPHN|nr:hypothetical protein PK98_07460 [Croceibacterium mercuriale]
MTLSATLAGAALALTPAGPAFAQETTQPDEQAVPGEAVVDEAANEIIVFARSLRGQVDAAEAPLLELGEEDIASYGAGSIDELLELLAPQVTSGSGRGDGRPVILVNGVRIASFRELRSYPPEAIEKVEVFPESVAQKYGYSADQRVVNIILKANYASREIEAEYGQPWDGGFSTQEVEATLLRISGPSRFNLNLRWENGSILTEAERGVLQAVGSVGLPGDPDQARYRSLVSDTAGLEGTVNWTTSLDDAGTSLSLNGTVERDDSFSLQGLDTVTLTDPGGITALRVLGAEDPRTVDRRTTTYSVASALNATVADWQLTGTVDASRQDQRTLTARRADTSGLVAAAAAGTLPITGDLGQLPDAGLDRADSTTDTLSSKITANGRPLLLPAGDLSVTLDAGYDWTRLTREDTRSATQRAQLTRGNVNGGISVSIPLTSVRDDFLADVGNLSLNLTGGVDHLSDFGTLTDWSAGLIWGVTDTLTFRATRVGREQAPSLAQLGNPTIETPNVSIFDFNTGQTVLATIISGGNPTLPEQQQSDWNVGVNWQLPFLERSNIELEYVNTQSEDVAQGFPVLTPTIEAAFPRRVSRDADGRLVSVDQRPVTFAQQKSSRIRVGLNLTGPLGDPFTPEQQAARESRDPLRSALRPGGGTSGGTAAPGRTPSSGQSGGPGGPGRRGGGFGADLTPEQRDQMAAFRQTFCSSDPAVSGAADLTVLPEGLQQRLRGPDGQIAPERLQTFRERFCSREAPFGRSSGAGGQTSAPGAGAPPPSDSERDEREQPRPAAAGGATPQTGGPAGGAPRGGPGGGPGSGRGGNPFGGGGNGQGRWNLNLDYRYELENEALISEGGPVLDLLNGDALTSDPESRHRVQLRGGLFYRGLGASLQGQYISASDLNGSIRPGGTDLRFGDLATFSLRTFVNMNERGTLTQRVPLLENVRVSFSIDNIFDARRRVTDEAGVVPIRYQPFLQDAVGRRFEIELRKLF